MKNRITKLTALIAILCVLVMVFAVQLASAASYSKVYGQTQSKVRVRQSASTNAAVVDNIMKNACIYITSTKISGTNTFVQAKYRAYNGEVLTGWVCQNDGDDTHVKILSAAQAENLYSVKNGNLPSKRVGTFTDAQRQAAVANASPSANAAAIRDVQNKLKALGFYSGESTGNAGPKTVAAIKAFQSKYGLTADGVAGSKTIAKIDSVYDSGNSTSSSSSDGSGLKLGSTGTNVRNLQTDLTTLGYYWADITGNFGSKTKDAVMRFQKAYGLTADGVAGSKTINALASAVAKKGSSGTSTSDKNTYLRLDSQGSRVSQLQTDLTTLGYYSASITGNFGEKTEAAVKKFQTAKGMTADGVAGPSTLEAIDKALGGASSSSDGVSFGSKGATVLALQTDLNTLGYYYGDLTGNFGSLTESAVRKFQKAKGLTADGVAGTETLNAIAAALGGSGSLSGGSSSGSSSLREGDSGALVTDLQTRLDKLGYYYGDITGNFGSLTAQAVRKFQDDNDLTVDGVAGRKTLDLLYSKTGGGSVSADGLTSALDLYGKINTDDIPLRKSHSSSSAQVTTLDDNDLVRITKSYNNDGTIWYYVSVKKSSGTYSGYVRSVRVDLIDEDEYKDEGGKTDINVDFDNILGMIKVVDKTADLRNGPGKGYDKVDTVSKGEVFYYSNTHNDGTYGWFQTSSGYWIKKDDVEVVDPNDYDDYVSGEADMTGTYRKGDSGATVLWIQQVLDDLDYYDGEMTGDFGNKTHDAVMKFQRDHDLSGDGVAGPKTLAALKDAEEDYANKVDSSANTTITAGKVYNVDWQEKKSWLTSTAGFKKGGYAYLTDIVTNKTMKIKIQSMGNHIDAEPATKNDTRVLCSLYGVTDADQLKAQNKYGRRAMLITEATTGYSVVCSIYAVPHGDDTVSENGYDGQFCLHTLNSKTHGTDRVDDDEYGHQQTISAGVTRLKDKGLGSTGEKYNVVTIK